MSTLALYIVAVVCGMVIGGSISYLLVDHRRGQAMNKALDDLRARHEEEREYWKSRQHAVAAELHTVRDEAAKQVRDAQRQAFQAQASRDAERRRKDNAMAAAARHRRKVTKLEQAK